MRVCPVCYCRLCYFDSERLKHPADDYLDQAIKKGSLRFPSDMMLFHIGRMTHMGLMCVSCGACEDACPSSIPIARIFCHIADRTQKKFDYEPGRSIKEPLPLLVYREDEFKDGDGVG
jgi:formate dehydrogenase subunit beta